MPVFCVVAVVICWSGIGILVAALKLAHGDMVGIIVGNGLKVVRVGKARA